MDEPDRIRPGYAGGFRCIGGACEDTCCGGWDIVIDEPTNRKYRALPEGAIKSLLQASLTVSDSDSDGDGRVKLVLRNGRECPLLTSDRHCSIHETLGEEYLSLMCAYYPRSINIVDGVAETALHLSCPEAARVVLLDSDLIGRSEPDRPGVQAWVNLDTTDASREGKPYRFFWEIRALVLALLRGRHNPLWQRLLAVGAFCELLDRISPARFDQDVPALIGLFGNRDTVSLFTGGASTAPERARIQLDVARWLIDVRLETGLRGPRFLDCLGKYRQGIAYTPGATSEESCRLYVEARTLYYEPFLDQHLFIPENWLINYVFRTMFPFGIRKVSDEEPQGCFAEFVRMTVLYSVIRTLLIGVAGYHQDGFCVDHIIELVQSFSKFMEHDLDYVGLGMRFIEASNLANMQRIEMLFRG